ncbi:MAG: ABC transporter permease [Dehalococcoidia bacterium]
MTGYIARRLLLAIPTLILSSLVVFLLIHMVPGDVIIAKLSESGTVKPEAIEAARAQLGLDKPIFIQYLDWLWGIVRLDAGTALWSGLPAFDQLWEALPVTIELAVIATIISVVIAIPLGAISAVKQNTPIDHVVRVISVAGIAAPDFWIAVMLIVFLSRVFGYLPPIFYKPLWEDPLTNLSQIMIPALILGYRLAASTMRMTRSAMLEVLRQDYVRTAYAKGLRVKTVIIRHALKNAMIPTITIIGTQLAFLFGGAFIMESLFALPGVGQLTLVAIQRRDYVQIQLNVFFIAVVLMLMNLAVDVAYGWFDPRLRRGY